MHLSSLINKILNIEVVGDADVDITALALDSRECKTGCLFAAFKGQEVDGGDYIGAAIAAGARAVLLDSNPAISVGRDVTLLIHKNPRWALGVIAAQFYAAQPKNIAAVTGTNGKTSVVNFTRQIWEYIGLKAASMGTLGLFSKAAGYGGGESLTTPDSVAFHASLANLAGHDITHLALEASSHGLDQERLSGINVNIGAITNFTRDHLDYHGSEKAYFTAKMKLFRGVLSDGAVAILNADIGEYEAVKKTCNDAGKEVFSYGKSGNYLKLLSVEINNLTQNIEVEFEGKKYSFKLNLLGDFQVANILCAMAIALKSGCKVKDVTEAVEAVKAVDGRMEKVAEYKNSPILIDYAHTPDALEKSLLALKNHVVGKLVLVFGCGGDRDKGKRPLMGEIAEKFADIVIVTDDNPRHEDAAIIRCEIIEKCNSAIEISDRKQAIEKAISLLEEGDILLVAGKGHEKYQIIGDEKIALDEVKIIKEFSASLRA